MQLIYLSPVSWFEFSQRPHEMVRQFHAKTGKPVLWIEPYPTRFPVLKDVFSRSKVQAARHGPPAWLTVVKPRALPIEPLPFSGWLNRVLWQDVILIAQRFAVEPTLLGIGKPSMLAFQLLREPMFKGSFYDAMDNVSEFYTGWSRYAMRRRQRQTAQAVTTVLASSSALGVQLSTQADHVKLLLNACASERLPALPVAKASSRQDARVFGYVGTIARWFDWALVIAVAKRFPNAEIRLIGPVHEVIPPALPGNIRLLPMLPHNEAVIAMAQFDVGLIPFKNSEVTRFVDPIKFYEYRALGLPVVSTAFGEMAARRGLSGVFLLDGQADIASVFERALGFAESVESTTQFRHANSWAIRFEDAHAAIL